MAHRLLGLSAPLVSNALCMGLLVVSQIAPRLFGLTFDLVQLSLGLVVASTHGRCPFVASRPYDGYHAARHSWTTHPECHRMGACARVSIAPVSERVRR